MEEESEKLLQGGWEEGEEDCPSEWGRGGWGVGEEDCPLERGRGGWEEEEVDCLSG